MARGATLYLRGLPESLVRGAKAAAAGALPHESRERRSKGAPKAQNAEERDHTAAGLGKMPTTSHRRASSRFSRSTMLVEWIPRQCSGGKSM